MADPSLALHYSAREVTHAELNTIPCPPGEGRWKPGSHGTVLNYAMEALARAEFEIDKQQLQLTRDDARFFGTLVLKCSLVSGVQLAVGIRSSMDRSISLQWCNGLYVIVCDNVAFGSAKIIARKHTPRGVESYPELIEQAVAGIPAYREVEAQRIRKMQLTEISHDRAFALLLRCWESGILSSPTSLRTAVQEWRQSRFEEFQAPTLWSLYNAVSFALKRRQQTSPQLFTPATIHAGQLLLADNPSVAAPRTKGSH